MMFLGKSEKTVCCGNIHLVFKESSLKKLCLSLPHLVMLSVLKVFIT